MGKSSVKLMFLLALLIIASNVWEESEARGKVINCHNCPCPCDATVGCECRPPSDEPFEMLANNQFPPTNNTNV
ncbi:hypothetical protein K1719_002337 [Acacia pycnantha]|nr:hypothetical protein K1719_002337 [Acacia pycnantha]